MGRNKKAAATAKIRLLFPPRAFKPDPFIALCDHTKSQQTSEMYYRLTATQAAWGKQKEGEGTVILSNVLVSVKHPVRAWQAASVDNISAQNFSFVHTSVKQLKTGPDSDRLPATAAESRMWGVCHRSVDWSAARDRNDEEDEQGRAGVEGDLPLIMQTPAILALITAV